MIIVLFFTVSVCSQKNNNKVKKKVCANEMKKDALTQKHQKVEMVKRDIMKKIKGKENKTNRNIKTTNARVKEIQAESLIIWFGKSVNEIYKAYIHTYILTI